MITCIDVLVGVDEVVHSAVRDILCSVPHPCVVIIILFLSFFVVLPFVLVLLCLGIVFIWLLLWLLLLLSDVCVILLVVAYASLFTAVVTGEISI